MLWHCDSLGCACAPFLQVDFPGFPLEESVCVHLLFVLRDGLSHLIKGANSDVGDQVHGSHAQVNVLHCKKEAINGMAPPDHVAVLGEHLHHSLPSYQGAPHSHRRR